VLQTEGVDFLKIHNGISREAFYGVMAAAAQLHLRVATHLPHSVSAEEAVDAGVTTLEHTETLLESGLRSLKLTGKSAEEAQLALEEESHNGPGSLIARMKAKGACFTPTLSEYRSFSALPAEIYAVNAVKVAPPSLVAFWDKYFVPEPPEAAWKSVLRQTVFREFFDLVRAMAAAGVPIMAGTDLGARDIYPGYSLHEELGLLSKAGLSNLSVLQAATINPATCMGEAKERGTIERGKMADLVIVEGDPLTDLGALGRLRLVVAGGRIVKH
jgi:imidazolonepropionase-like amidohydrolase